MIGEMWRRPDICALYRFSDETDSSGNGNTLTNPSSVEFLSGGRFGKHAYFNTNEVLYRYTYFGLDLTQSYSMGCWFLLTSLPENLTAIMIIERNSAPNRLTAILYRYISGVYQLRFLHGGNNASYEINISTNTWYHVAGASYGTYIYLYLNGNRVASGYLGNEQKATQNAFSLGSTISGEHLLGRLDECIIWNRCLTPQEVRRWYGWSVGKLT
jgi:hypothetical protein